MTDDTTNKEGFTVRELASNRLRCLDCGAYKDETPGEWFIEGGIVSCPDCKSKWVARAQE